MRPYLFKIGSLEIRIYSLMYIISLFLGIFIAKKDKIQRKRLELEDVQIENYAYIVLLGGIIGARLYYVIFNHTQYIDNPISALYIWQGGLAIHGGIIGGIISILIYSKLKNQNFFALTDLTVIPLILAQSLGRIGNFFNGEVHGVPVFTPLKVIFSNNFKSFWQMYQNLPLKDKLEYKDLFYGIKFPLDTPAGIEFPGYYLHPAMLYECVLNFLCFLFMWFIYRKRNVKIGQMSFMYLILYGIVRFFVSFFRAEDLMIYNLRLPHIVSLVMIVIGIIGLNIAKRGKK